VELLLAAVVLGILCAIAIPRTVAMVDMMQLRGARQDVVIALAVARATAARQGSYVGLVADSASGHVRVSAGGPPVFDRDLRSRRGVRLTASRDSITFAPGGLGYGAANTTIVVSRGGRSDTITTSRLGRVR
jgi:Tfp pilus assembly protein FimT